MFVLFMIYFTSKIWARVEPGRLAVPVAFRIGGFDLSFVETFDGRDRHVLSSLLVFLRECNRICKSDNGVSESRSSRGTAIGSCLLLVRFPKYGLKHASDYYTDRGRYSRDGRINAKYSTSLIKNTK